MSTFNTPFYQIDEAALLKNMEKMAFVAQHSGAKCLLALKCFATWPVFDLMQDYMAGTTSSSLYEVKLGREKFAGETHAYSVAWADHEIDDVLQNSDKIIFNSLTQLARFRERSEGCARGLRVNPRVSSSDFILADPARPHSRLGESDPAKIAAVLDQISGFMFHNNCENGDFALFSKMLDHIESTYGELLHKVSWVSLGGGIHFTGNDYPLDAFCARLKRFADTYHVQVYLEPGEASITNTASLEVTVLDIVHNDKDIAIVDSSIEAHMLDLLIYRLPAKLNEQGSHRYQVCGKSCLAGDIFGEFDFPAPLHVGDRLSIQDVAGYTMVKKNWFNGLTMPSIVIKRRDGRLEQVQKYEFADYLASFGNQS
ncbi:carboxynorspermidine decarboxylase [Simiduia aestuariiviva]|uniref:Carboxynorspermidine/carboxyspermidine decarboxylase n=1 Tax=Simiduia aestuariiviva TaxID=1510459 RepID=A0A839UQ87_9GAMM|nr:carboxynorspermidine decarboxylase [Simiduia aestuariiviva]MBB3168901.1 carboxynorspermidine decarboxylase [Simiduia aestuariiviva]